MPPLQPLKAHGHGQPNGYQGHSMRRHTLDTTGSHQEPRARVESSTTSAIQLWQNVHSHKCITTKAMNPSLQGYHATAPFEVLLGFCKLLQVAVSKLVLYSTHTCSIPNATSSKRNSTDLFCL